MKERIQRAISHLPPGGIALHGTSLKKALSIAKRGLNGHAYVCPIPNPNSEVYWTFSQLPPLDENAFLSRAIGSVLFASSYSLSDKHQKSKDNPGGELRPLPAVVIFSGWDDGFLNFNLPGNDPDTQLSRILANYDASIRIYLSFGKSNYNAPPQMVCAIANLSQRELDAIKLQAHPLSGGDFAAFNLIFIRQKADALVIKTLRLIEKLTFLENKPSEILRL